MTAPIDDIYPLSPAQTGMLFHTLLEPGSGVYVEQLLFTFDGHLDPAQFERAWQRVIERHGALRTCFAWDALDEPMQVVQRWVPVSFAHYDWRGQSDATQEARLTEFLRDDRRTGFDLSTAPLMRFTLAALADDRYTLVWTHHHILLDGWSVPLVLEEVFTLYRAFLQSRDLVMPVAPSYRDYVAWLLQQDPGPARAFWRHALDGFTTPTPLVVERAMPAGRFPEYSSTETTLSAEDTSALRDSARGLKVTLNTLAQGAWGLLLSRYSNSTDVIFGAIVAGRPATLPGVEDTVGMFINTLPVRVRLSAGAVVGPWLQALQREQVAARRFEHSPLAEVQQCAAIPSDRQLFDSVLAFENYPSSEPRPRTGKADPPPASTTERPDGLRVSDVRSFTKTNYPLNIVVIDGARLRVKIVYDEGRFEPDTMERMLGHFTTLMRQMAAHPDAGVASVRMLADAERRQVLVEWNDTSRPVPSRAAIPELFDAQAARTPDALAIAAGTRQVSYATLRMRANRIAGGLRALGVGPDVTVAICLGRSIEQITASLAILKAGGAYVPLDPDQPPDRLRAMAIESGAAVLLTDAIVCSRLMPLPSTIDVRSLDVDWPDGEWCEDAAGNALTADHLAYVIFTSGSTGRPNGVAVSHRALVNLLSWHQSAYEVTSRDRATQLASPGFDASVWEVWPYFTAGASIHLPPEDVLLSPRLLVGWLADASITLSFIPTPLAELVLGSGVPWPSHLALRVLLTGGDALRRPPREPLPFRFVNHYGPTENAVVATAGPIDASSAASGRSSIGRPIANTKIYVLDDGLEPLPVLVPGELCIGGAGLARGYLNNPDLTSRKFVANPHGDTTGERLFRTGDIGRFLPNGEIEFIGRLDSQVKIRGVRIELGEVERAIARHPAIQAVAAAVHCATDGDPYLVAYFVASPAPAESELRRFTRDQLPAAMVPSAFVPLDSLPLTRNGKIDRRALPAPSAPFAPAVTRASHVAAHGDVERAISQCWQDVLHVDTVDVTDNFFDVGGHSLLVFRLHSKLGERLERELTLMDLFTYPTVRSLASFVQGDRPDPRPTQDVTSRAASQRRAFASRSRVAAGRGSHDD